MRDWKIPALALLAALALLPGLSVRAKEQEETGAVSYAACDKTLSAVMATCGERFWGSKKTLPEETKAALSGAEEKLTARGITYSFCVLNLDSGRMATANTLQRFYSASCVKAPFITGLLEAGYRPTDDMYLAGHNSDNEAYERLWYVFGTDSYRALLTSAGVRTDIAAHRYANLTSLELLKLWYEMTPFLLSEEAGSAFARDAFTESTFSVLADALGEEAIVYSKAGWISDGDYSVYNAAGLVLDGDHPYLVSLMTTAPGREEDAGELVSALALVHEALE